MNMKNFSRLNVRKHREINNSEKYITFYISLKLGSLEKMKIVSSEKKDYFGRLGKGLITSLGLKTILKSNKNKKSRYRINNFIMKDLSNVIKEF